MTTVTIDLADALKRKHPSGFHAPVDIDIDTVLEFADDDWTHEVDVHELLAEQHVIAHLWGTEDVLEVRPDLTEDQAWEVLRAVDRRKDANSGICWESIEIMAEELFPEPNSVKEQLRNRLNGLLRQVDTLPDNEPGDCGEVADKLDKLEEQIREEGSAA